MRDCVCVWNEHMHSVNNDHVLDCCLIEHKVVFRMQMS